MDTDLLKPELLDPNERRGRLGDRRGRKSDTGDDAGYLRISKDQYGDGTEDEALERQGSTNGLGAPSA